MLENSDVLEFQNKLNSIGSLLVKSCIPVQYNYLKYKCSIFVPFDFKFYYYSFLYFLFFILKFDAEIFQG